MTSPDMTPLGQQQDKTAHELEVMRICLMQLSTLEPGAQTRALGWLGAQLQTALPIRTLFEAYRPRFNLDGECTCNGCQSSADDAAH